VWDPFHTGFKPAISISLRDIWEHVLVVDHLGNEINREEYTPSERRALAPLRYKADIAFGNKERMKKAVFIILGRLLFALVRQVG